MGTVSSLNMCTKGVVDFTIFYVSYLIPSDKQSKTPKREAVSYRGLFTAGWFGVREKHCSRLEIYDRLRASEQAQD